MNGGREMVYIVDQKRAGILQVEVRDWLESRKDMGMYILGKRII